jgi:mono/diheme cytochrome c family protein
MPPALGLAQDAKSIADGEREFLQYCAICHGNDGKGKGILAEKLTTRPADLTQINKRNGSQFPFWRIYKFIDGRRELEEQESRVMPIWGDEFLKEAGSDNPEAEAIVKERILRLVYYLQSIQKE